VPHYKHTQPATVIVVPLALALLACLIPPRYVPGTRSLMVLIATALLLLLWMFSSLTITVNDRVLGWYFGPGWIRKDVPLDEIRDAEAVETRLLDGWGIRRTRRGWLYNASGFKAVAIKLHNGERFVLGTDEPERLLDALSESLPADTPE
jgi:hypothetical protein